jgi:hypothetical protein
VIGIADEVLAFAQNTARHPETWLDFLLLPDDESVGLFSSNFFSLCSNLLLLTETTYKVSSLSLGQCVTRFYWPRHAVCFMHYHTNKLLSS